MSFLWTSQEAAAATGGQATGNWQASGLSIDTRSLGAGDLFIALKDQRDGHDFVADALAKGAAAAMVERVPDGVSPDAPLLIVANVLRALEELGVAGRGRTKARVIAVTGSVGKTSTKEMLRTALAPQGRVHAAEKSFNNHWGVPLTLARCPADADFAVIEIGMNHPGEIAPLVALARPHVAIVTTVAPAHLAAFADITEIAQEKAAIFGGLVDGGTAILNADLKTTPILSDAARRVSDRVVGFGESEGSAFHLVEARLLPDATEIEATLEGKALAFRLSVPGRHFALNALACLAAVAAVGGDPERAAAALADWHPPEGRGTREHIALDADGGGFDLLDDAYNANPTSMAAALEVLAAAGSSGRRVAILGDMLELGPTEAALHAGLAAQPAMAKADVVHCVGPRMQALYAALPTAKRGMACVRSVDLATHLSALVQAGDTVLVKGSLGSNLRVVVDGLRKMGHRPANISQGPR